MAKIKRFDYTKDPEQWAEIHTRPTWGQVGLVMDAINDTELTNRQRVVATILAMTEKWRAVDEAGVELPLTAEGIDKADAALVIAMNEDCSKALDVTLPKK